MASRMGGVMQGHAVGSNLNEGECYVLRLNRKVVLKLWESGYCVGLAEAEDAIICVGPAFGGGVAVVCGGLQW
eukprot:11701954-Ditylum_brightwellii.AAC.1